MNPLQEIKEQFVNEVSEAIQSRMEPVEPETNHYFAAGVYAREMKMTAGMAVVGKKHKKPCINVVSKGLILVINQADEKDMTEYKAGDVFVSPAGTRRALFALEDSAWITFHATDETDLEKLEQEFIEVET